MFFPFVVQIVMEYCSAGSVADIMTICGVTLAEEQISHICASVLMGFEYLHASKHIHRVRVLARHQRHSCRVASSTSDTH